MAINGLFLGMQGDGPQLDCLVETIDAGVSQGVTGVGFDPSTATDDASLLALANAAIATWQSGAGVSSVKRAFTVPSDFLPMYVSGTQKANTYPIVAAPAVAGGSGVARFYIDSNGDGTGTAPSEVYADSLQAVVYSTTGNYVIQSVTVDANRKYIDVKMGVLTFTTGIAGLLNVLTGATIGNAANGTAVKCTVFVKK